MKVVEATIIIQALFDTQATEGGGVHNVRVAISGIKGEQGLTIKISKPSCPFVVLFRYGEAASTDL